MNMKEALAAAIKAAAVKAIAAGTIKEGDLPEVLLEVPPQKEFGDFATNFAMQSARGLKCNPRLVAQAVIDNLDCPYVAKAEIAGPGFINFYLKQNWTAELLASIVAAGADYGNLPARGGEKIQLEYVSANPTGPLHVGIPYARIMPAERLPSILKVSDVSPMPDPPHRINLIELHPYAANIFKSVHQHKKYRNLLRIKTSVNGYHFAGNITGIPGNQKTDKARHFFRHPETAHRNGFL